MRWILCTLVVVSTAVGASAQQRSAQEAEIARPQKMRQAVGVGDWVKPIPLGQGVLLEVWPTRPGPIAAENQPLAIRSAEAQLSLVQSQHQANLRINQENPGTIAPRDVAQSQYAVEQARLRLAAARSEYDPDPYQVFAVGDDFVGLQRGQEQRLIAWSLIHVIVRPAPTTKP